MLTIRYVTEADKPFWLSIDKHVTEAGFLQKVRGRFGYVIFRDQIPVGLFHYNVCLLYTSYLFRRSTKWV